MDKNLLKTTAQRLNLHEESVIRKCEEYMRMYQAKASIKTLNDQVKTVLCLDLASKTLGMGFDKEAALKLCAFKKAAYQNSLNTLEKVLDLDRALSVSDVCVQLGCTDVKADAEAILEQYSKADGKVVDLEHPQYVAAATYLACKAKKHPVDKPKIMAVSRLKAGQWKELIANFESLGLGKKPAAASQKHREDKQADHKDVEMIETDGRRQPPKQQEVEEPYEQWKQRILDEAYATLSQNA